MTHRRRKREKSNILKTEFTFIFQRLMLDARRLTFIHRSKSVSPDCVLSLTNGTCIVRTGESAPAPCLSTSHLSSYPIHPNKYSIHWNKYKHQFKQIQTLIWTNTNIRPNKYKHSFKLIQALIQTNANIHWSKRKHESKQIQTFIKKDTNIKTCKGRPLPLTWLLFSPMLLWSKCHTRTIIVNMYD